MLPERIPRSDTGLSKELKEYLFAGKPVAGR